MYCLIYLCIVLFIGSCITSAGPCYLSIFIPVNVHLEELRVQPLLFVLLVILPLSFCAIFLLVFCFFFFVFFGQPNKLPFGQLKLSSIFLKDIYHFLRLLRQRH